MESSVYDDRQFELDALGHSKPVETGNGTTDKVSLPETTFCYY